MLFRSVFDIEIRETGNELTALLLEQKLIRTCKPPINRQVKLNARPQRTRERYPRLVLLPSTKGRVQIYAVNPGHQVIEFCGEPEDKQFDHKLGVFFQQAAQAEHRQDKREELIYSWLTQNRDRAHSIDMRQIASLEQGVRLLHRHAESVVQGEQVVHV